MSTIDSGAGDCHQAQVYSDLKLAVRNVMSTESQDAAVDGRSWNINTGIITSVSGATNALLYFENEAVDNADFFVDAIAFGASDGLATDVIALAYIQSPTGGTLFDAATDCDMIRNRRGKSGKALSSSSKAYKATASGQTITGGNDAALFFTNDQGRLFASVDFIIPKGDSCGLRLDVLSSSFNGNVYGALIGHYRKVL